MTDAKSIGFTLYHFYSCEQELRTSRILYELQEVDEDGDGMISFREFMMIFRKAAAGKYNRTPLNVDLNI